MRDGNDWGLHGKPVCRLFLFAAVLVGFCAGAAAQEGSAVISDTEDAALKDPIVAFSPGPEYGDDTRPFQGIPGIERASNGRLWATWYGGGDNEGPYNYCMLVTSADDGQSWTPPIAVVDTPGDVRTFDPCLWIDPEGRLWWFWAQGYSHWDGRAGVWEMHTDNPGDAQPSWSSPRRICDGIMMNKPTVLSTGEWLLPVAIWALPASVMDPAYAHDISQTTGSKAICSTDKGATWFLQGQSDVPDRRCDEHLFVEKKDGTLWVLVRTQYGVGEAFSPDRGKTWEGAGPSKTVTHIPHARFFIRRLSSGNLLLVKHDPPDGKTRSHLTAFLSEDDGATWQGGLMIDERAGVSYPDATQAPDGTVYLIYDRDRKGAREILMATFTEEDVRAAKPISNKARMAVLVNKATSSKAFTFRDNADGADLLGAPYAKLEPETGSVSALHTDSRLFTDRDYVALELPAFLEGRQFIHSSIDNSAAACTQPGTVFVLTPLPDRNKDSVSQALHDRGFVKAKIPEFILFGDIEGNIVSVFQKKMEAGEEILLGKWGVIVF